MSPHYATAKATTQTNSQILRDPLAADRTILANERTFLAYIRTAMTMLVGGISLISFFPTYLIKFVGALAIIPAIIMFVIGFERYTYLRKNLIIDYSKHISTKSQERKGKLTQT
jgi:putative membrane protein